MKNTTTRERKTNTMITSKNSIHGYSYDVIADQLNVT